ncbi:MAG: DUF3019 domain-containing protein [Steroidobacteraceae bacterium]|jgi:hypothetical protein|nr:DUF3019 domain-containing protein [Steroidobacteraceae bacterium]
MIETTTPPRRFARVLACALACGLVAALVPLRAGTAADARELRPTLRVRPVLCIAEREAKPCETLFRIDWKSARPGDFCLGSDRQAAPLRCWSAASAGEHDDVTIVTRDFEYWLAAPNDSRRLTAVRVELLYLRSEDRRRQRRSRHVWDVL